MRGDITMPMPQSHYPPGWTLFSIQIRYGRAHSRCECTGQCGLHRNQTILRRCTELNHRAAHYAHGKIVLTVAHLCQCNPICLNPAHVIAACQRCHLRIDRFLHARHRQQRYDPRNSSTLSPQLAHNQPRTQRNAVGRGIVP